MLLREAMISEPSLITDVSFRRSEAKCLVDWRGGGWGSCPTSDSKELGLSHVFWLDSSRFGNLLRREDWWRQRNVCRGTLTANRRILSAR